MPAASALPAIGRSIDEVLARELGGGPYRTRVIYTEIYFNEGVYARLLQNPKAMEAVLDVVRKTEGIWRVYRKEELSGSDPLTRAPALSHYEGRSGDIKILARAYWIASTSTTTHGTGHRYDTRVPVVLFGYGIKSGEYLATGSADRSRADAGVPDRHHVAGCDGPRADGSADAAPLSASATSCRPGTLAIAPARVQLIAAAAFAKRSISCGCAPSSSA